MIRGKVVKVISYDYSDKAHPNYLGDLIGRDKYDPSGQYDLELGSKGSVYMAADMRMFKWTTGVSVLVDDVKIHWSPYSPEGLNIKYRNDDCLIGRDEYRIARKFFMYVLAFIRCEVPDDAKNKFVLKDKSEQIDYTNRHITETFGFV